jgi:hypothetical protein
MSNFIKYLYFTLLCFFITLIIMDFFDKSLADNLSLDIHSRDELFLKNKTIILAKLRETQINNNILIKNLSNQYSILLSFNDKSGYFDTKFIHKFASRELLPKFELLYEYLIKTYSFYKNCSDSLEKMKIMHLPNAQYTTANFSLEKQTFIQNHKNYEKSNIEFNNLSLDILNYLKKFSYFLEGIRLREKNSKKHFRSLKQNINESREYNTAQKSKAVDQIETIEKNLKTYIFKQNIIPSFEGILEIALEDFESIIIRFIKMADNFIKTPVQSIQELDSVQEAPDTFPRVDESLGDDGLPMVGELPTVGELPIVGELPTVDLLLDSVNQIPAGVAHFDSAAPFNEMGSSVPLGGTGGSNGLGSKCVNSRDCVNDLYCRSGGFFKPKVCKEKKLVSIGQTCNESEGVFCYSPDTRKIECNRKGKCSYTTNQ